MGALGVCICKQIILALIALPFLLDAHLAIKFSVTRVCISMDIIWTQLLSFASTALPPFPIATSVSLPHPASNALTLSLRQDQLAPAVRPLFQTVITVIPLAIAFHALLAISKQGESVQYAPATA